MSWTHGGALESKRTFRGLGNAMGALGVKWKCHECVMWARRAHGSALGVVSWGCLGILSWVTWGYLGGVMGLSWE